MFHHCINAHLKNFKIESKLLLIETMPTYCCYANCKTRASFGLEQDKLTHCKLHKTPRMINWIRRSCLYDGCRFKALYGNPLGKYATKCANHASKNMIQLSFLHCQNPFCDTKTIGNRVYCEAHKPKESLVKKRCAVSGCERLARYGKDEYSKLFCATHAMTGMVKAKRGYCAPNNKRKKEEISIISPKRVCVETDHWFDLLI